MLYLKLAQNWYWGYEYDFLAFVRRPGFPLWIALWRFFGIPFAIVQQTAYAASLFLLVLAARRLGAPRPVAFAAFGLGLFHPLAIGVILRVTPDGLYTITAQCILAFLGFWLSSRTAKSRCIFSALAGVGIGLLVITRDEQIVAFGFLTVVACIFLTLRFFHSQHHPLVQSLVPCFAAFAVVVILVILANKRHFGVFAIGEFTSGGFSSAYQAALSIPQEKEVKGVAITALGLEQVYLHSPSWALLADSMRSGAKPWSSGRTRKFFHR